MLDVFIIQKIKEDEERRRRESERPRLDLPHPEAEGPPGPDRGHEPAEERGVTIINRDDDDD